jgi:hypothetical protein
LLGLLARQRARLTRLSFPVLPQASAGAPITVWVKRMDVAGARFDFIKNVDPEQLVAELIARWMARAKLDLDPSLVMLRLVKCGARKPTPKHEAKAKELDEPHLTLANYNSEPKLLIEEAKRALLVELTRSNGSCRRSCRCSPSCSGAQPEPIRLSSSSAWCRSSPCCQAACAASTRAAMAHHTGHAGAKNASLDTQQACTSNECGRATARFSPLVL